MPSFQFDVVNPRAFGLEALWWRRARHPVPSLAGQGPHRTRPWLWCQSNWEHSLVRPGDGRQGEAQHSHRYSKEVIPGLGPALAVSQGHTFSAGPLGPWKKWLKHIGCREVFRVLPQGLSLLLKVLCFSLRSALPCAAQPSLDFSIRI